MRTIFVAILFATSTYAGAADAHGGGGAEPMPGVSFTDMPSISAKHFIPPRQMQPKPIRWRQGSVRSH